MTTVQHAANKNVAQYCDRFRDVLTRMVEHAKSGGCGAMSLVPRTDGSGKYEQLPDLIAFGAEDVYGNKGSVRLRVTYNASTGEFHAGSNRHPGACFRIDN